MYSNVCSSEEYKNTRKYYTCVCLTVFTSSSPIRVTTFFCQISKIKLSLREVKTQIAE